MKKVLLVTFCLLVAFSMLSAQTPKHPITPHRVTTPQMPIPQEHRNVVTCYPQSAAYWTGTVNISTFTYTDDSEVRGRDMEDGWFMFDISAIPVGSIITDIVFHGYVNYTNYPYWGLYAVYNNPLTADADTIAYEIGNGAEYLYREEEGTYSTGWKEHVLNSTACTDLQSALTNGWWAVGMNETDDYAPYYIYFDGWNEANPPYIEVSYESPGSPDAPHTPTPTDAAVNFYTSSVDLSWYWGANTESYELYFGTENPPTTMIASGTVAPGDTTCTVNVGDLEGLTHYFWYVKPINSIGANYSDTWSFTIYSDGANYAYSEGAPYTNCSLPMEPYYGYSYSQTVYLQSELDFSNSQIERIFYVAQSNEGFTSDVVIYMAHTEQDALSDWLPISQFIKVYDGQIVVPPTATSSAGANIIRIDLDTPFYYNNVDNLVIAFEENTPGYTDSNDEFFCCLDTLRTRSLYYYNDYINPDPVNPPTPDSLSCYYPSMAFEYFPLGAPGDNDVYISEISDNLPGQEGGTGYVELYNNSMLSFDLGGCTLVKGNEVSGAFVPYVPSVSYEIPAGTVITPKGYVVVGNGINETAFKAAWGITADITYLAGDAMLDITNGWAYLIGTPTITRGELDHSPDVPSGTEFVQSQNGNWQSGDPLDATPGGVSDGQTLPVELSSFTAIVTASKTVMLEWMTQSETGMIGYHVLRGDTNVAAEAIRLTDMVIEAANNSDETAYSYEDLDVTQQRSYYYWLEALSADGETDLFGPVFATVLPDTPDEPDFFATTMLQANCPNPFNPSTEIAFELRGTEGVPVQAELAVYNVRGQRVKTLVSGMMEPGAHSVTWNGTDENGRAVSSGVYFYRLTAPNFNQMRKMMLLK